VARKKIVKSGRQPSARAKRTRSSRIAKVTAPRLCEVYTRTRLFKQLDECRKKSAVWISGPAGAGKTTLVASYIQQRKLPCLWYQIDPGDADLASFFHYLGLACQQFSPRKKPLPVLKPEYLGGLTVFARNFFRQLYERLPGAGVMVLDNVQELSAETPLNELLPILLDEIPDRLNVILISRAVLPDKLARLRVNNKLASLDWDALQLTDDESLGIAMLHHGKTTDVKQVAENASHAARGWMAGLILLLEGASADEGFTLEGSGVQTLFSYFISEVFSRRPESIQLFLMQTSLFPFFTSRMAEELTGNSDTQKILSDLVRQHHFTEKRNDSPPTYQYHPLFKEFLRQHAASTWIRETLAALRTQVANILTDSGESEQALWLYLDAHEFPSAVGLIVALAPDLVSNGRFGSLVTAMNRLPAEVIDNEPWLLYWRGICALANPVKARNDLEQCYAVFVQRDDPAGMYLALAAIINSYNIEWSDFRPTDRWIDEFNTVQARHPEFPSRPIEAQAVFAILTVLLNRRLNGTTTSGWATQAESLMREGVDIGQRGTFGISLVLYYCYMGETQRARNVAQYLHETLHTRPDPSVATVLQVGISYNECMHGTVETAIERVNESLENMERSGAVAWMIQALGEHMYADLTRGDAAGAQVYLEKMRGLLSSAGKIHTTFYYNLASAVAFHRGDLDAAADFARDATKSVHETGPSYGEIDCFLAEAHIALSRGDHETAEQALMKLKTKAVESESKWCQFCAQFTEARLALESDVEHGLILLRQSLALSKEMEGRNLPWIAHSVLRQIFSIALEHKIETRHVQSLIQRYDLHPGNGTVDHHSWPYPVKIYTLGRFKVLHNNSPLPRNTPAKPLELLKALIAFGGRDVSQEHLADALWPDAEGDTGRRIFDTTLHRLRKILGKEDLLILANGLLTLDSRYCWVDLWGLKRELSSIETILREDKGDSELEQRMEQLWKLYPGPFLSGDNTKSFSLTTREQLHVRVVSLLQNFGRHLEDCNNHEAAITCYEKALGIDPLVEHFYQRLIQLYIGTGRRADAVKIYKRCVRTFKQLLDVAPSPETSAAINN